MLPMMPPVTAVKNRTPEEKVRALDMREALQLAEAYLFDHVSSFVLPGEPQLADGQWRFPVYRAYATEEERTLVGSLLVDPIERIASFSKLP
jgi:hypothetical protein